MRFDIDRININSSLKYRLMFIAGGMIHVCYIVLFLWLRIIPLVCVNICSVLLYALGSLFSVNKKTGLMKYGWMMAFYSEITIHTTLCMVLIGIDTDFYLYSLMVIPVAVYVLYLSCTMRVFLRSMVAFAAVTLLSMLVGFYADRNIEFLPYYPLTYDEVELFRVFNVICASVILLLFSLLFALEIHVLMRRLEESNRQLEHTATHDALTGLLNRRSLKPQAAKLADAEEHFCVALGDIDDFKQVNDTYGHDAGDTALRTVAGLIHEDIAEGDIACRWGGEEILLVLRGSDEECIARLTEVWKHIAAAEMEHESGTFHVTITFGFASCNETRNIEKLVSAADKRLYAGKIEGKNVIISE